MQVTSKIKMDLTKPDLSPYVNAVQGDSYSRSLEIALYTGVHPWTIPEDTSVAVRYAKPDRTGGYYDTLPDGTSAWHISGNTLTIQLAPQMLTVAGNVKVQIELIQGTSILSTFCLTVRVEANAAAGVLKSENYINWLQWIQNQSAEQISQIQQSVQAASQAAHTANQASQSASLSEVAAVSAAADSATSAKNADSSANQAAEAVASVAAIRDETNSIAAGVSAIVAGNEAYTKSESDSRFCPVFTPTVSGTYLSLRDSLCQPFRKLTIFGKTTHNGTPSSEAPTDLVNAGSKGSITVTVTGKNLCAGYKPGAYLALTGLYQAVNDYQCTEMIPVVPGAVYTYSNGIDAQISDVHYYSETKEWLGKYTGTDVTYINIRPQGTAYIGINHYKSKNLMWVQLELGSIASCYEAYIGPQILAVSTGDGLAGIPVSSGGNYTDESGQQWICDEINLAAGIKIQRIGKLDSYNGEAVGDLFMSSTGALHFGASVLYLLEKPIEIPLSAGEVTTFRILHTYHPYTSVLNDDGAWIEASYIADIQLYIDNKFSILSTAVK